MNAINISGKVIGLGHPIYVIAEMAWSHDGDLATGIQIFRGAKEAGADAVGVHITDMHELMVKDYRCLDGQTLSKKDTQDSPATIFDYLEKINTSKEDWAKLFTVAREIGLHICAMPSDVASLKFVRRFSPEMYAISAAVFTELDLVRLIAAERKPTVLRVGGATLGEIEQVLNIFRQEGNDDVVLLHGVQMYPTDIEDLNLKMLPSLRNTFGCHVGLADHIDGGDALALSLPLLAIPLSAVIIEKHITDDRSKKREDYEAALGTKEFGDFVKLMRQAEKSLGSGNRKQLSEAELKYRRVVRKKVVAARPIAKGHIISSEDITCKRADHGGDPTMMFLYLGRKACTPIDVDEGVELDMLE